MKAVRIHTFGGPEVLSYEDVPRPQAGPGEVLVRVYAAGVNPADWKTRANLVGRRSASDLPMTLGWDASGVVEEVGPGVTSFEPGAAVYGLLRFPQPGNAYAEYASAPVTDIAPKPANLAHVEAAAVPLVGLTAWQALFEKAALQPGQSVLVNGAAGGVGHIAVQLARAKGARVLGTASAGKLNFIRGLGVEQAIDYKATPLEQVAQDVDVFFDTIGNAAGPAISIIRPGGVYVSVVPIFQPSPAAAAKEIKQLGHLVYPSAAQLAEITRLIKAGQVRPYVETVLPLAEVRQAHELSQSERTTGKIVLKAV